MPRTMTPPGSILPQGQAPAPAPSPAAKVDDKAPLELNSQGEGQSANDSPKEVLSIGSTINQMKAADDSQTTVSELMEERKLLDQLYHLSREVRDLEEEEATIAGQLGAVQANLREARDARNDLIELLPSRLIAIREKIGGPTATGPQAAPCLAEKTLAWKSIPTAELLDGIRGLGAKRLDQICDAFPTAGDLENARAEAYKERKNFGKVLPRGTGAGLASDIEERLLDAAMGKLKSANKPAPGPSEATAGDPSEPKIDRDVDLDPKIDTAGQSGHARRIRASARAIAAAATPESIKNDSAEWADGLKAFHDGQDVQACPEGLDLNAEDLWVKGWLYGHLYGEKPEAVADGVDSQGEGQSADSEVATTDESVATAGPAAIDVPSLVADLLVKPPELIKQDLADWINRKLIQHGKKIEGDVALAYDDENFFGEGQSQFLAGEAVTEIPVEHEVHGRWEPTTESQRESWLQGWLWEAASKAGRWREHEDRRLEIQGWLWEAASKAGALKAKATPLDEPVAEPTPIAELIEQVKESKTFLCQHFQDDWDAGHQDGAEELPIREDYGDCNASRLDYVRGYLVGSGSVSIDDNSAKADQEPEPPAAPPSPQTTDDLFAGL